MQTRNISRPNDLNALDELFEHCSRADGHRPLGEHKYLSLISGTGGPSSGIVGEIDGRIAAYAHITANQDRGGVGLEIAVDPAFRSDENIREILQAGIDKAIDAGASSIRVWVYRPGMGGILAGLGFCADRELRQLRRPLPLDEVPSVPPEMLIRGFRLGGDEGDLLAVNNQAFLGHPENGEWDIQILHDRQGLDWFDAQGIRMLWKQDELAGFCWTKLHEDMVGEIYVIAINPSFQGRSLGRTVAVEGLRYLHQERGATSGMLYVDSSNQRAMKLYESLGFYLDHVDRAFVRFLY